MNIYAPVIIPTLCRYQHLKRCIESLKKNKIAPNTELFIGIDYPAKQEHWPGYSKIKEYLEGGVDGFANVTLIFHDENKGEEQNIFIVKQKVFEHYDRYIFTEDDNEFSPNFLEFMNKCLEEYEDDSRVQAITGYAYPIHYPKERACYFQDVYFAAYGYGIWKKKEEEMFTALTVDKFRHMLFDASFMTSLRKKSSNQYCNFIKGMLGYGTDLIANDKIRKIDIAYGIWMAYEKRNMIFPTISMVRNWGFDGTGVNCDVLSEHTSENRDHRSYEYSMQPIDENEEYVDMEVLEREQKMQIDAALNTFFRIHSKELFRTTIALYMIKLVGLKNARKLISRMKRG